MCFTVVTIRHIFPCIQMFKKKMPFVYYYLQIHFWHTLRLGRPGRPAQGGQIMYFCCTTIIVFIFKTSGYISECDGL